ncbi:MFS transporter [Lysinibacter cavernae]|uniref:Putative MFS family arabinose efflux permease n=1 Tax=Lysinibacter cavernae TaxID=1640652 RepID=A0A7X5TTA6_9MICO|nr:MFS transporter [Lysinibacter cavernae]NIH52477.1 putative MFS family arabinose efflux permease [Lysinibacter cavernae]
MNLHPNHLITPRHNPVLAVLAVAFSTFLVVTSEMMPVGALTLIADDMDVSAGTAGMTLTITGLVAALACTLAPVLARQIDRRIIMVAFMLTLAAANVMTALAPNFAVLAVARVLLGIAMGMVWGLAAGLGGRLVPSHRIGTAMTVIFSGVSVASVVGVPLGTYVADVANWRVAFWLIAGLGTIAAMLLWLFLPALPATESAKLRTTFAAIRTPGVTCGLIITGLVVFGHFTGYTYVRPILESQFGLTTTTIAAALMMYGIAGLAGTFLFGPLAHRAPKAAVVLTVSGVTAATTLLAINVSAAAIAAFVTLALWGIAYGGISVSTQAWTASADPARVESSSALWSGLFNASIAMGSVTGGIVMDQAGEGLTLWFATSLSLVAVAFAVFTRPRPATGTRSVRRSRILPRSDSETQLEGKFFH